MNSSSIIQVRHLRKTYIVPERGEDLRAAFKSLIHRRTRQVLAVDDISFSIAPW